MLDGSPRVDDEDLPWVEDARFPLEVPGLGVVVGHGRPIPGPLIYTRHPVRSRRELESRFRLPGERCYSEPYENVGEYLKTLVSSLLTRRYRPSIKMYRTEGSTFTKRTSKTTR